MSADTLREAEELFIKAMEDGPEESPPQEEGARTLQMELSFIISPAEGLGGLRSLRLYPKGGSPESALHPVPVSVRLEDCQGYRDLASYSFNLSGNALRDLFSPLALRRCAVPLHEAVLVIAGTGAAFATESEQAEMLSRYVNDDLVGLDLRAARGCGRKRDMWAYGPARNAPYLRCGSEHIQGQTFCACCASLARMGRSKDTSLLLEYNGVLAKKDRPVRQKDRPVRQKEVEVAKYLRGSGMHSIRQRVCGMCLGPGLSPRFDTPLEVAMFWAKAHPEGIDLSPSLKGDGWQYVNPSPSLEDISEYVASDKAREVPEWLPPLLEAYRQVKSWHDEYAAGNPDHN